ncbi:ABC transporter substrate-binding protein [Ensifer sp.]|uniref:ABC transporter substrate-binding protein n=1 Tax=Ensifer sp. TaxID=1872086 RepID=UPI00289E315F|nr:ABC transporter substrate-binding protein [Ensifer sp.]
MRIGVHPNNLHLRLAQLWPGAFAELDPIFVPYGEGRDTGALIHRGDIDFGGTGSTPPLEADARGLGVEYIAASAPRPANGAIFVRAESDISAVADLVGRRISLIDGSFHTYLLARSLEGQGLSLCDVERVESGTRDSLTELLEGRVDAWVAMSPRLEKAIERSDLRLLLSCGAAIPNRSLFWTLQRTGLSAGELAAIAGELNRIGQEVGADPKAAARLLAADDRTGTDVDIWERVVRSRDFTVGPIDAAVLAEQQEEADTLHRHGHFLHSIAVGKPQKTAY